MLSGKRILIVEEEFLIALDIQRILEAAGTAHTVFARSVAEADNLHARWCEFDLVLVDMSYDARGGLALARQILDNGVPVAITASDLAFRRAIPALPGIPVILKPFEEKALLAACSAALVPR